MITNRLIIREFKENSTDMIAIYEIMSDDEVNKYLPWMPLKNENEALDFFKSRIQPRYDNKQGYYFAVCLKNDDKPIGYVTVSEDPDHDLGYGLRKEYWGMGLISEAVEMVVQLLKEQGWHYITATHDINNIGSGKVMEKIGMEYKYSYREQWQPKDILVTFRMYQLNFDGIDRTYTEYWDKYEDHFIEPNLNFHIKN
ncbi:GNAT family N-acetyltransferase [Proteus mirabilis]|nr:GNAT family N-acetyltransferase [Proteus mirabilis]EKX9204792.1 GNAT family N-acetyltransferase [Proteus mirabilis]